MPLAPSPLEAALLGVFHELYGSRGFPSPERILLLHRENTGAGRYTDLAVDEDSQLEDGYYDLQGAFIEMDGVPNGMMAVVRVKDRRPDQLEIAVYGDAAWDGKEREWCIT